MKRPKLFQTMGLLLGLAAFAQAQQQDTIAVNRIAMCAAIVEREPSGESARFEVGTEKVYCFTELNGAAGEVTYAWFLGDSLRSEIKLNKGRPGRWRMWSNKTMSPNMAGEWKVEVRDTSGKVLESIAFTFGEAKGRE